ncbi:hypothetical protein GCM10007854_07590 [Algimonas porphyrae]|uniref:Uncharacterized protein n=1 Tax=Algimonas porphyrae TaxID=1128113 RepID=A0ABQ5UWZ1_9PROT|nr:hypothetical protein GCM10007854_07590 [Algimonas porphyrae]
MNPACQERHEARTLPRDRSKRKVPFRRKAKPARVERAGTLAGGSVQDRCVGWNGLTDGP